MASHDLNRHQEYDYTNNKMLYWWSCSYDGFTTEKFNDPMGPLPTFIAHMTTPPGGGGNGET